MTQFIKKSDGSWCAKKITLACTVIGTMAAVIGVAPVALGYVAKVVAPWTTYPEQLNALKTEVDGIADALGVPKASSITISITNNIIHK
jgi:hypothetical protein